jgi:hypothetical protein
MLGVILQGHLRIDRRNVAMHHAIACKLRAHPELLEIARENLARWSSRGSRSQPYWDAWREILTRPVSEVLESRVENSERMTAMRQASPFAGVLDESERRAVLERFSMRAPQIVR